MEYQKLLWGDEPYMVACVQASYPLHCHHEIEVMYCLRGKGKVIMDDQEYELVEGSIIFINSLAFHQLFVDNDSAILVLEFGSQLLGTGFRDVAEYSFTKCLLEPNEECPYRDYIINPLEKLYYEQLKVKKGFKWAIQGYLFELFAMIVRYVPMNKRNLQNRKKIDHYIKIQNVFELVRTSYHQDITLEMAAACVGYETSAFCRLFKSTTNMTFHNYLNYYRINIAMRLLEQEGYSIETVGQMTGIPVPKTFSRLFKQYTGMSPSSYRNKYMGGLSEL
ncbi:MAG: AraC family transcriptional regulator [Clostridia bacterium]|nr:AraC family transcriptional regulator [Clostridia bacterium]